MLQISQHGDSMHLMRPDRVYKTGVLAPVPMQIGAQVAANALAFTRGLGAAGGVGFFKGLMLKYQAWANRGRARAFARPVARPMPMAPMIPAVTGQAQAQYIGTYGVGPEPWAASIVAPNLANKVPMLIHLGAQSMEPLVRAGAEASTMAYWNALRWMRG